MASADLNSQSKGTVEVDSRRCGRLQHLRAFCNENELTTRAARLASDSHRRLERVSAPGSTCVALERSTKVGQGV